MIQLTQLRMLLPHNRNGCRGFTLAESMITLLILSIIAIYTVPKLINNQQNGMKASIAKEFLGTFSEAYHQKKYRGGGITPATFSNELTPYMNFVKVDSTTTIDDGWGGSQNCSAGNSLCLELHTGAIVRLDSTNRFCNGLSTEYINAAIDPDGSYQGTVSGKGLNFQIYYNGRITTKREATDTTCFSNNTPVIFGAGESTAIWFEW